MTTPRRKGNGSPSTNGDHRPTKSTRELLGECVPPSNLDAEKAVLGSILRENDCLPDVMVSLTADDFYSAAHQKIFAVMTEMFNDGLEIDTLTLADELSNKGCLLEIGGAGTLLSLFNETLTSANVARYVQIVVDKAQRRNLIMSAAEILRDAYEETGPTDELIAESEVKILSVAGRRAGTTVKEIGGLLATVLERARDTSGRSDLSGGVLLPFESLNDMLICLHPGNLVIVAARPSVGKTTMVVNMIHCAVMDQKIPTLFHTLEAPELEIAEKILCLRADVNNETLRKRRCSSDEMHRLSVASAEMSKSPLFVDEYPANPTKIAANARRHKRDNDLGLLVVDHVGYVTPEDPTVNREQQISTVSRRLKQLAKELKIPCILVCPLNRKVEERDGQRPRLSDLRDSGNLESDADVAMLLSREDYHTAGGSPELLVNVAKNRNGSVGEVRLSFNKQTGWMQDVVPINTPFSQSPHGF